MKIALHSRGGSTNSTEGVVKVNLRQIAGPWTNGYALDKHIIRSVPIGYNSAGYMQFETDRTDVGEAVFQLKYRGDYDQVKPLAKAVVKHIVPLFGPIGLVIPAPASVRRRRQPVTEVASAIAERMGLTAFDNIVVKNAAAANSGSLKDMKNRAEKEEALRGRFTLNDGIDGNGRWNALVVDDLHDSGATLGAICAILATCPKIGNIYVAALTWK